MSSPAQFRELALGGRRLPSPQQWLGAPLASPIAVVVPETSSFKLLAHCPKQRSPLISQNRHAEHITGMAGDPLLPAPD